MNNKKVITGLFKIAILYMIVIVFSAFQAANETNVFVSPNGNDNSNGTINSPVRTIPKAQSIVKALKASNAYSKIIVNLMQGEYQVTTPLIFTNADGGSAKCAIEYAAYKKDKVTISGGKILPANWIKSNGNIWKLKLNNLTGPVNQLFANDARLSRCHSPVLYTTGPIKACNGTIRDLNAEGEARFVHAMKMAEKDMLPFSSFAYSSNDLRDLTTDDINNAEIMLYHSWETTWHQIGKIDKVANEIYLKSPAVYPVGLFYHKNRYVVENCKKYLKEPGTWFYDNKNQELSYIAKENENPNSLRFVIPVARQLLNINGSNDDLKKVENIKFTGIQFKYSVALRGMHWTISGSPLMPDSTMPWIDLKTGFSDLQGAVASGQAVLLQNAENIVFDKCEFTNLGTYGIRLSAYTYKNNITNCQFYNLAGGGIIIGTLDKSKINDFDPGKAAPSNNNIKNCKIHDLGIVYTSALGIGIMNAVKTDIDNNEIYNTGFSGISSGWTWGRKKSYTRENIIQNNHIHHVVRLLADGGGIYTLGRQTETIIRGNKIHDIDRLDDAVGSRNNGIFFDEGSARIFIDDNNIYNIKNEDIRYNQTSESEMTWGTNMFDGNSVTGSDGQSLIPKKKLLGWFNDSRVKDLTNNIFESSWVIYGSLLLLVILLVIVLRVRRKRKRKTYKQRFRS